MWSDAPVKAYKKDRLSTGEMMKIRNKILIYFSSTVILLTAVSLLIVYWLFAEYREEEFQQRQSEKINLTIELISEYKAMSENLASIIDKLTIHDFYDEKMLIFDQDLQLLFSSIDDLKISDVQGILNELSEDSQWYESKQGEYDIVAVLIEKNNETYYAISKAYDAFGYTKIEYLRNVLVGIFVIMVISVLLIGQYLSNKITKPITEMADQLNRFDINQQDTTALSVQTSSFELDYLVKRFNELLKRTHEAFSFQKHTVHHISHQLKTPISVLVSELERIHTLDNKDAIRESITHQIHKAKSLGGVINALLEIAKLDAGQPLLVDKVRIDELLFDIISDLHHIDPTFQFNINYIPQVVDEDRLHVQCSQVLVSQLFKNLLSNAIAYADVAEATITIDGKEASGLLVTIENTGKTLKESELKLLFDHFFRGENSEGIPGFGLGLVLSQKIVQIHNWHISYEKDKPNTNRFIVKMG